MKISYFLLLVVLEISATVYGSLTKDELETAPNSVNYETAVALCKSRGLDLIKIQDEDTNQVVYDFAIENQMGTYWIQGNDSANEGKWKYDDGTKLTYSKWQSGEPNDYNMNEDCIRGNRYPNGFWNDASCNEESSVICYKKAITITKYEENFVIFPNKANYEKALSLCNSNGMNLIKIHNESINKVVHGFAIRNKLGTYWIDANDISNEGQWKYADGTKVTYSKWRISEPNNYKNEDCVIGNYYPDGLWNDIACGKGAYVICSKAKSTDEERFFASSKRVFYKNAINICKWKGMNLIKIQDDDTNKAVHDFATRNKLGAYWIDGNDIVNEGEWKYEDGTKMTYSKWEPREPNNYNNNEDCIIGNFYSNGFWNDIKCEAKSSVICDRQKSTDRKKK